MRKVCRGRDARDRRLTIGFEKLESRHLLSAYSPIADEAIIVTSPANQSEIIDRTPTISWEQLPAAASYEVWGNRLEKNGKPVSYSVIRQSDIDTTSYTPQDDLANGSYRVWVRADNGSGQVSRWSEPIGFTIDAPQIVDMTAAIIDLGIPTIEWTPVADAMTYELWVNYINDKDTSVHYQFIRETSLGEASYQPSESLPDGDYWAWVRGSDAAGNSSPWSDPYYFRISVPSIDDMPRVFLNRFPILEWDPVAGADRYEVWTNRIIGESHSVQFRNPEVTTNWYEHRDSLPPGEYRFWVQAFDKDGNRTTWSEAHDFVVADPTIDRTPSIQAHTGSSAANHELRVSEINEDGEVVREVMRHSTQNATVFALTEPLSEGVYHTEVRGISNEGLDEPWTTTAFLAITDQPVRPILVRPFKDGVILDAAPQIRWEAVAGADLYELHVEANSVDGSTPLQRRYSGLTGTSFEIPEPLPAGTYKIWLQASNYEGAVSGWSLGQRFEIREVTESTRYLQATLDFVSTLMSQGTDRYGPESSPMFAAILDLRNGDMPRRPPPLLPGQREADRALTGANLHQDLLTLTTMYHLSNWSGDTRYAAAADDYLTFFLERVAPTGLGLFPAGEHAFWDFFAEDVSRPIHQDLGLVPEEFLERMWEINPQAVENHLRAQLHHFFDLDRWYWNRNVGIFDERPEKIRSIPRHGGFYIYQWSWLYKKTGDPELLEWARRTAEVHWAFRDPSTGLIPYYVEGDLTRLDDPDNPVAELPNTLALGTSILRANELLETNALPRFDEIGGEYVQQVLRGGHDPANGRINLTIYTDGRPYDGDLPWIHKYQFWESAYPASGGFGFGLPERFIIQLLNAHRLTGSEAHLQFAIDFWDYYQTLKQPTDFPITPGKFAGLIAISLDLYELVGEQKYLDFARQLADEAIDQLFVNGLFQAALNVDYYEAANGAGSLALELFRLHLVETGDNYALPRNYWDP